MDTMTYHAAYKGPSNGCEGCVSRTLRSQRVVGGFSESASYCWYECELDGHVIGEHEQTCAWWDDEEPDGSAEWNMRGPW